MGDPYCWPGSDCLRNKLGLRDKDVLAAAEQRIVTARGVEVARSPIFGEYDLDHLKRFHRALFGDLYDWAGETRTVDISLPGSRFAHWAYVDDDLGAVLRELSAVDRLLMGLSRPSFVERLAFYYGEINARHPFREGNGRTQRSFLRQLSAAAGWVVDWTAVDRAGNVEASRRNLATGDTGPLIALLEPVVSSLVEPDVGSLPAVGG